MLKEWTERWWLWWAADGPTYPEVYFLDTKKMERNDNQLLTFSNKTDKQMILFPVDKWISLGFPFSPDSELKSIATERIDMLVNMAVQIDGKPIMPVRVQTDPFILDLKNEVKDPELGKKIRKGKYKAVGEGYWIFEKLESGHHKLESYASCKTRALSLAVEHCIDIE